MLFLSSNGAGRLFQTRGPATAKLLSPDWVLVHGTTHVRASADRRRRPTSATNRQSSERYGGVRLCRALYTRTASLNSTRRRTGSQWSCRKTGVMCSRRPVRVMQPGCGVLHRLQPLKKVLGDAIEYRVAVIQPTGNDCLDHRRCGIHQICASTSNEFEVSCKCTTSGRRRLRLQWKDGLVTSAIWIFVTPRRRNVENATEIPNVNSLVFGHPMGTSDGNIHGFPTCLPVTLPWDFPLDILCSRESHGV